MSEPVVLIIDDEEETIEFIRAVCKRRGLQVIGASSGREGLALARSERPAVILIDLLMPELNGFEICRELGADPVTAHIPKAVLTASASVEDQRAAAAAGADQYLLKPAGVKLLTSAINDLLALSAAQSSSPSTVD